MILASYRRRRRRALVVCELTSFLEPLCIRGCSWPVGLPSRTLCSRSREAMVGGWRTARRQLPECSLPFSAISALSLDCIPLDPGGSGFLNRGHCLHIGWHNRLCGVSHKSRLCSYRSLTRTRNKCEVCLAAPALHTLIAALVLNT